MSSIINTPKLKFKSVSKKGSNLLKNTVKSQVMQDQKHFICGLRALSKGILNLRSLNHYILLLRRFVGKGRINWPRIHISFNFRFQKTKKSEGHRMGHGKGKKMDWSYVVLPGEIFIKVLSFSKKYIFLDSFSWTHVTSFFDQFHNYYWSAHSFSKNSYKRKYKFIYIKSIMSRFSNFTQFSFRNLPHLRNIYRLRTLPFINQVSNTFNLIFFILNNMKLFISVLQKNNSSSTKYEVNRFFFLIFYVYSCFFINNKYVSSSSMQLCKNNNVHLFHSRYFSIFLSKFWIFGFFYNVFSYHKSIFKSYTFNQIRMFISFLSFFKFYIGKLSILFKKPLFSQYHNTSHPMNSYKSDSLIFSKTRYLRSYVHSFRYPRRRPSLMSALFRGCRKLSYKVPFKSEIIFYKSYPLRYFLNKSKILKHVTYGMR